MKNLNLAFIGVLALGLISSCSSINKDDDNNTNSAAATTAKPCNNTASLYVVNKTALECDFYVNNVLKQSFKTLNEAHTIVIPANKKVTYMLVQKLAVAGITRNDSQDSVKACGVYNYEIK